jgi:N12 class adenine-specific DNA methylase
VASVWQDDERRERLCRLYNDLFNHSRVRTLNDDHLTLPGASQAIQLRAHQKAGVWRILQTQNTLLAHVVGAGKTYTTRREFALFPNQRFCRASLAIQNRENAPSRQRCIWGRRFAATDLR